MMMLVIFLCFNKISAGERSFVGEETISDSLSSERHHILYNVCDAITMTSEKACDGFITHVFCSSDLNNAEGFYSNIFESTDTLQNNFEFENTQTNPVVEKKEINTNDHITDFSVNMDTNEPFLDINTSELEELNPIDLKEILDNEQRIIKSPTQSIASLEIDHIAYNIDENNEVILNDDNISQINFKERRDLIYQKYMLKFKNEIYKFIKQNFSEQYVEFYIKRLECIECSFNLLSHDDLILSETHQHLNSTGNKILEVLYLLCPNFIKKEVFDFKTCQDFMSTFDIERKKVFNGRSGSFITKSSEDYRTYCFYIEMLNLYKYIDKIPELLFLSGLFYDRSYCDISFFLNIMNSFIKNIDNLEDYKVFNLCMLNKVILSSNKKNLDIFLISKYHIDCHEEHFNMHFLLWEICSGKRADMKKRLRSKSELIINAVDKKHLKTILLIYLYQHFDFLIYYNFSDKKISYFYEYVIKVLNSEGCVACDLDEYLEILKSQISNIK